MTQHACSRERTPDPHDSKDNDADDDRDDDHLSGVEVGAGCTEIWEHLADQREE